MAGIQTFLHLLLHPRGRMNRSGLLVSASLLLVVEVVIMTTSGGTAETLPMYLMILKGFALWIATVGIIKRLHDTNVSAWWALMAMAALCGWSAVVAFLAVLAFGVDALNPAATLHIGVLGLIMLPALGMALWLHLTPGTPATNRFGPVPNGAAGLKPAPASEVTA